MRTQPLFAHPVIVVGCLAAQLSAITCGGDVVVDDDVRGSGGSGDGASGNTGNQGASGNVGNQGGQGNTGDVGPQGGMGNVGNQAGVGGSRPDCHGCAEEILCLQGVRRDPDVCRSPLCPGSGELFGALIECVCFECAVECANECAGIDDPSPDCAPCQTSAIGGGPCTQQFNECSNDF